MSTLEVRKAMKQFWMQETSDLLKLPQDSKELVDEIPEILDLLPVSEEHKVLELGAGDGRFSGHLAKRAKSVVTADFMSDRVKRNKEINGVHNNITFVEGDVTSLEYPAHSFDLVFSNWLLMYLKDEEVCSLFQNILKWLRPGGHLFFRESCFHQSAEKPSATNPTIYRLPATYNALFQSVSLPSDDGAGAEGFELVLSRSIQAFVRHKNNSNQVCWLLQKVCQDQHSNQGFKTFQEFLDNQQYSRNGILRYEKIFGHSFISTGGKETTEEFVPMLDLKAGQYVLDVGCGIGGSAFYMAQTYGAHVLGIDLSSNMVAIALERANEIKDNKVQFEVGDATKRIFKDSTFDVIYSRDTILHIQDKKSLFSSFLSWLKPGGKLLISDYSCTNEAWSDAFTKYVAQRGYNLLSVPKYGQLLEEVGFVNVRAEDRTEQFVNVLNKELIHTQNIKHEFLLEFSQEDYEDIINGWQDKVQRCGQGDQKWGLFYAEKPIQI